eukprot:9931113-Lingulodinium_polyedra.AAC.1
MRAPDNWRARKVRERAICKPLQRRAVYSTAPLRSVVRSCAATRSNRRPDAATARTRRARAFHA